MKKMVLDVSFRLAFALKAYPNYTKKLPGRERAFTMEKMGPNSLLFSLVLQWNDIQIPQTNYPEISQDPTNRAAF